MRRVGRSDSVRLSAEGARPGRAGSRARGAKADLNKRVRNYENENAAQVARGWIARAGFVRNERTQWNVREESRRESSSFFDNLKIVRLQIGYLTTLTVSSDDIDLDEISIDLDYINVLLLGWRCGCLWRG